MSRTYSVPGVYRQEIDLSEIILPRGISNGGIVVRAKTGPVNRPVLISNDKEFIDTFGNPIFTSGYTSANEAGKLTPEYGYGAYASLEFLKESSTLYVVRAYTPENDVYSNVEVTASTSSLAFSADSDGISGLAWTKGDRLDQKNYISVLDKDAEGKSTFIVGALGPGKQGDNIAITIETFSLSADWRFVYDDYPTSGLVASATNTSSSGTSALSGNTDWMTTWYPIASNIMKINVYTKSDGTTWDSLYRKSEDRTEGKLYLNPVETFYGSLKEDLKDGNGNNLFIEPVINGNSNYIYVKKGLNSTTSLPLLLDTSAGLLPYGYDYDSNGSIKEEYIRYMSSATSGSDNNRLMVLSGGKSKDKVDPNSNDDVNAWAIFEDRENVDVQILIGTSNNTSVKQEMGRIAATRADAIATVQAAGLSDDTTSEVIAQEAYGYRTPSYVAIYGGYSKIYDQYNDKFVYLPNSIFGAALFARVDNIANPWDAPAGINRAVLSVLDQRKIFVDNEIGKLYDRNINVPKFIRGTGYVMWGQKTAQLKASALDRINVRRNLLYIENNVEKSLLPFVFENNTAKTRLRVWSLVDEFLAGVQAGGGLTAYQVVVDETNNTPAVIDSNRLNVDIYVQPARTIEFIQLTTVITRTGVSFEEVRIATA